MRQALQESVSSDIQLVNSLRRDGTSASPPLSSEEGLKDEVREQDDTKMDLQMTLSEGNYGHEDSSRPPPLNYDLKARKASLCWNVFFMIFFNVACPILIFCLLFQFEDTHRAPEYNNNILYGATTATLGTLQLPQFAYRWWQCRKRNNYDSAPFDTVDDGKEPSPSTILLRRTAAKLNMFRRWDAFQMAFFIGIIVGSLVLVLGTSLNGNTGYFPLLAIFAPVVFAYIGIIFLVTGALHHSRWTTPFPLYDRPRGERARPALGYAWPDLVAIDGGGLTQSRVDFTRRYEASEGFRMLIVELNWVMGFVMTLQLIPCAVVVGLVDDRRVAFGTVFAVLVASLFVLFGICVVLVKRGLKREEVMWQRHSHGQANSHAES